MTHGHAIIAQCNEDTREQLERFPLEVVAVGEGGTVAIVAAKDTLPDDIMMLVYGILTGMYGQSDSPNVVSSDTVDVAVFALARCLCKEVWPCPECMKVAARHVLPLVNEFSEVQAPIPPAVRETMAGTIAEMRAAQADIKSQAGNS